jgi:hypothetical protein
MAATFRGLGEGSNERRWRTDDVPQTLKPGERMNFINEQHTAIRVRVVTACGTETVSTLHPGARLEMTVGRSAATVYIVADDDHYTGLELVP